MRSSYIQEGRLRYYGKLPGESDYLSRRGAMGDSLGLFEWVEEGNRYIKHFGGIRNPQPQTYGIVFISVDGKTISGSIRYSHDCHGRQYPFACYVNKMNLSTSLEDVVDVIGLADGLAGHIACVDKQADMQSGCNAVIDDSAARHQITQEIQGRLVCEFSEQLRKETDRDFDSYRNCVVNAMKRLLETGGGLGMKIHTGRNPGYRICSLVYWIMLCDSLASDSGLQRHYLWDNTTDASSLIVVPGVLTASLMKYLFDSAHVSDIVIDPERLCPDAKANVRRLESNMRLVDALRTNHGYMA